jgi:hypothetical protein
VFGPSVWSPDLLCPRLTSVTPSRRLSATLAQGRATDLPGYCAPTFPLMSAAYTSKLSVQVLDFEDLGLLIQLCRLLCGFCSSDQRFACGFLRIPPRGGHPCRPANDSPCRVRGGLSPPSECALPGAPKIKKPRARLFFILKDVGSSGRTRTYNPPVTHNPMFSHRSGLSHQLSYVSNVSNESCRALFRVLLVWLLNP